MSLLTVYVTFVLPLILIALGGGAVALQRASKKRRNRERSQVHVNWRPL